MSAFGTLMREAWLWLGASVLLAVLWTNLAWLFSPWADAERSRDASASLPERTVSRLANWRFAPSLFQALRLLYYVGLPSAALFWGNDAVVRRLVGLKRLALPSPASIGSDAPLDANWSIWVHDLGWAAMVGLASSGLLLLAAVAHRQALSSIEGGGSSRGASGWEAAREALYHEVHWAFYRNAPIVALGAYWGTWAGLGLVAVEALINPTWRQDLGEPGQAWPRLSRGALAVVSAILFLRTQNLWLALLLHWGISWLVRIAYTPHSPSLTGLTRPEE